MSIIGILHGNRPTLPSVVTDGSPSTTTVTSVEVPPPSSVITLPCPALAAIRAAPSAPAAGPDSTVVIGWLTTSRADRMPPLDFITENGRPSLLDRLAM